MDYWDKKLHRKQISSKLEPLKTYVAATNGITGWVKTIREALCMTMHDLANRIDMDQAQLSRIEKSEPEGKVTLTTMQRIGEGLGMKFVYGFVPEKDLESLVRQQAKTIAMERLQRLDKTMALELQDLDSEEKNEALSDMMDKLLIDLPIDFWRE